MTEWYKLFGWPLMGISMPTMIFFTILAFLRADKYPFKHARSRWLLLCHNIVCILTACACIGWFVAHDTLPCMFHAWQVHLCFMIFHDIVFIQFWRVWMLYMLCGAYMEMKRPERRMSLSKSSLASKGKEHVVNIEMEVLPQDHSTELRREMSVEFEQPKSFLRRHLDLTKDRIALRFYAILVAVAIIPLLLMTALMVIKPTDKEDCLSHMAPLAMTYGMVIFYAVLCLVTVIKVWNVRENYFIKWEGRLEYIIWMTYAIIMITMKSLPGEGEYKREVRYASQPLALILHFCVMTIWPIIISYRKQKQDIGSKDMFEALMSDDRGLKALFKFAQEELDVAPANLALSIYQFSKIKEDDQVEKRTQALLMLQIYFREGSIQYVQVSDEALEEVKVGLGFAGKSMEDIIHIILADEVPEDNQISNNLFDPVFRELIMSEYFTHFFNGERYRTYAKKTSIDDYLAEREPSHDRGSQKNKDTE